MIVTADGKAIDDSSTLADATALRDKAQGLQAEVDSDIVLFSSPWFRAHAGAITVTPYVMRRVDGGRPSSTAPQGGRFALDKVDNATSFYAEVDYLHRRAWLDPENLVDRDETFGLSTLPEWLSPDDHEIRLRFTNASQIDGAASAASGDWAAETSIGWNLLAFGLKSRSLCEQQPEIKKRPQGTVNLEVGAGLVTDRDALDTHLYAHTGLASVWSFPMEVDDSVWRTATVLVGLYYGLSEFPQLDSDDQQHVFDERAQFNQIGALSARLDFTVPLGTSLEAVVGGRLWDPPTRPDLPENWSLFVGITVPLGRILKATLSEF